MPWSQPPAGTLAGARRGAVPRAPRMARWLEIAARDDELPADGAPARPAQPQVRERVIPQRPIAREVHAVLAVADHAPREAQRNGVLQGMRAGHRYAVLRDRAGCHLSKRPV